MRALLRRVTSLHSNREGQTMAFVALTGFLICCFVILMLNNGRHLTHRVTAQNAVDSAAISAATWQARGMNLIAMTNIMKSMLLAEAIFTESITWAVLESADMAAANASCFCDPWCDLDFGRCWQSIKEEWNCAMVGIQLLMNGWPPLDDQIEFLFDRMDDLTTVAESVREGFEAMAMTEGTMLAQENGLDYAFVWPNTMPLKEGELTDLCDTMINGDDGGYDLWENAGVKTAAVSAMLYFAITAYESDAYAPALAAYPHWASGPFGSPTQQLPYQMLFGKMAPLAKGNTWWETSIAWYYMVECQGLWWYPSLEHYVDTDKGNPLILDDEFPDSAQYVAIGYDSPEQGEVIALPDHFNNPYNEVFGMITVAQAEVTNTYDGNMFVPRWHAHLVPVSRLGDMPLFIADYMLTTPGLPMPPDAGAIGRISLWTAGLSDLTQQVITH